MGKWMNRIMPQENKTDQGDHIPLETLAQLIDGDIDQKGRAKYLKHLNTCPECYELLTETLKGMPDENFILKESPVRWSRKAVYAIAASIILILIAGGNFLLNRNQSSPFLMASITLDQQVKDILLEDDALVWDQQARIDRLSTALRSKGLKLLEINKVVLDAPYFQSKDPFSEKEILSIRVEKGVAYLTVIHKKKD